MECKSLIQQLEKSRDSRVITYLTSDRQGPFSARIAVDVIPLVSKQLQAIGKTQNIDLFLYTAGGDTMVPWRLVSMIREYCDQFSVIVPYKAHSAGTMIALGADEIVMSDLSEDFADRSLDRECLQSRRSHEPPGAHSHFRRGRDGIF